MLSRSRGYLRLLGAEPGSPIEIQPNFLCEPEDVSDLVDAVDLVMDLAATKAYADWFDGYAAPETRLDRAGTVRRRGSAHCGRLSDPDHSELQHPRAREHDRRTCSGFHPGFGPEFACL